MTLVGLPAKASTPDLAGVEVGLPAKVSTPDLTGVEASVGDDTF